MTDETEAAQALLRTHRILSQTTAERDALRAEVERLRADVAARDAILRQVLDTADEAGRLVRCPFCGTNMDLHADDCQREQARALLGTHDA